jgi:predicted P-loop ATPase
MLMKPAPYSSEPNFKPRPLRDDDVAMVQQFLQDIGLKKVARGTCHDAMAAKAREFAFHPVRNYLNTLSWDGQSRLSVWLNRALGVPQSEYSEEIGKLFLISMIARVMRPGCKADYMMILEGPQGALKSSACAVLAGEWFDDHMPDIEHKDAAIHLRGKWLIEWAEMRAYTRAAADQTKVFLTRQVERFRPPHGREEVIEPRQCIFIGSTNKAQYLTDETGARRFWPVKCGEIDLDWLKANRDQLFAEALSLYHGKQDWWPSREFEKQVIESEQSSRYEADAWEEPIAAYLETVLTETTLLRVAQTALGFSDKLDRLGRREQVRIASIITHLGWKPGPRNKHIRPWIRR